MSTILLSNGELVNVPSGADPVVFKRIQEAKLRWTAKPKRKPATRKASTGRTTRRSQKAAMDSVTSLATLTLVERVNGGKVLNAWGRATGDPQDEAVGWAMAQAARRIRSEIKPVSDDLPFDGSATGTDDWADDYGLGAAI